MPHRISWIGPRTQHNTPKRTTIAELSTLNAHDVVALKYILDLSIKGVVPHENWTADQIGDGYSCPRCPGIVVEPRLQQKRDLSLCSLLALLLDSTKVNYHFRAAISANGILMLSYRRCLLYITGMPHDIKWFGQSPN